MVKAGEDAGPKEAAQRWEGFDISELLSESAKSIGAGSATDAGRFTRLPTDHPHPIVLGGGIPDAPNLPVDDLREAFDHVLSTDPEEALRYGGWLGFDGLRQAIAERQSRIEKVSLGTDNFIVHNGSSGSTDNVCRAFLEPGDVIIVERPSFSGTVRNMRSYLTEIVEVPILENGVSISSLAETIEQAEASGKRVKFFYTIADYHNPTGVTMSEETRSALIQLCGEHHILIVEDSAYTELYFGDEPPLSLYSMANGHGVLRLGTLSKTIATGLRVGWVQARPDFIEALQTVRFDMGNSPLFHRALAEYVGSGKLDAHVDRMRPIYAEKCDVLCESLMKHCEPYVRFVKPDGGFFLWVECIGAKASDLARAASEEGLVFPLGSVFFQDRENLDDKHIRLAFSNTPLEELEEFGERLKTAFLKVVD